MGRIIYDAAASANGWIADQSNSLQWLYDVEGGAEPAGDFGLPDDATVTSKAQPRTNGYLSTNAS